MAGPDNPHENAQAKVFFETLKRQDVGPNACWTYREAERRLATFFEDICNRGRLHCSSGYLSPDEFETAHAFAAR